MPAKPRRRRTGRGGRREAIIPAAAKRLRRCSPGFGDGSIGALTMPGHHCCRPWANPGITRRGWLRLAAKVSTASALAKLTGCDPNTPPLRIALNPWPGYQMIYLARQAGLLPMEGIQLLETRNPVESAAALEAGRIDGAALTLDDVLHLREQGLDLRVVMVFDVSAGGDAVLARPGIHSLADLKGKRLAVEKSNLGAIMLAKVLEAGGLERSGLIVQLMDFDHVDTWNRGNLDAIITYEPALGLLLGRGLVRIFDTRNLPQTIFDVLAVRPEAAARCPDALRALIAGHFQGVALWHDNPIDAAYRLSSRLGIAPEQVGRMFGGMDIPDVIYNRRYMAAPAEELNEAAGSLARIMLQERLLQRPPNLEDLFVPDYLPGDKQ